MANPIYRLQEAGESFTYFHTLHYEPEILQMACTAGKSLEIDVSVDDDGQLYVGHPLEFYAFKGLPAPSQRLKPDDVVEAARQAGLFLIVDCKDERALPWAGQTIKDYGAERTLFHSWIDAFRFEPYPPELVREPHWHYEDLPFEKVSALKRATGVPIISSARGLTTQRLRDEPKVLRHVLDCAQQGIDVVNFNLPNGEMPDGSIINSLLTEEILTLINVDRNDAAKLPTVHVGSSDFLDTASDLANFKV